MTNVLGLDETPYFSWVLESEKSDTMQDAYQIQVENINGKLLWDSGKVISDQDSFVIYDGLTLKSREECIWKVNVWDNYGNLAVAQSKFEMGLLGNEEWTGKWVQSSIKRKKTKPGFGKQDPATLFRKSFCLKEKPVKARGYATCHGVYRLTVNGLRPDMREFAPEHTVYEKYLCYQTYDLSKILEKGENVLGMYVGDGWYYCQNSLPNMKLNYQHAVLFQIECEYADGSRQMIGSDEQVKVSFGPVRSSDLYAGEQYDAREEKAGWDQKGYDDSSWKNAKITKEGYDNLRAQYGEPVEEVMTMPVKEVLYSPKGENILDFGQNLCGRVRFQFTGTEGQKITLEHTETLDKDGNFENNIMAEGGVGKGCDQKVEYIAKDGQQEYEPYFTFHGFRYVRVKGMKDIHKEDFQAVVLSTVKEDIGSFCCSDSRINRLYENTRWSQRSNMLSIPTDCPQREKAGWTGDVQIYTKTAMLNEDMTVFLSRWLENMTCDQDKYGVIPMVVPYNGSYVMMGRIFNLAFGTKGRATSSGWGDAAVITPYRMYEVTGNKIILKKQYNTMKKWCDYIIREAHRGVKKQYKRDKDIEKFLWDTGYHYGEWLIPSQSKNGMDTKNLKAQMEMSAVYTAPIFGWLSVSIFAEISRLLEHKAEANKYKRMADHMKKAIQASMFDENGDLISRMMGAYVLFLHFDLVPEKYVEKTTDELIKSIENNGECLDTGFLATPYLLETLCKIGRKDMAYKLLWQNKCPSWLFEVEHGATTIWESWFGYNEDGTSNKLSMNHYSFGCVDEWMFKHIGGIDTKDAGFKHIMICPDYDCGIEWAQRSYRTEHGLVSCEWKKKDGTVSIFVTIPCNTTAEIVLPNGDKKDVGSGKYEFYCKP